MTKLTFLIDHFDIQTAIGRVLLSFCRELWNTYNIETSILAAYASPDSLKHLPEGLTVEWSKCTERVRLGRIAYTDYLFNVTGHELRTLIEKHPADCYVHISCSGFSVVEEKVDAPLGYYSHGLIFAGFFSQPWYQRLPVVYPMKAVLRFLSPLILSKTCRLLDGFDFFLANSQYTKEHLYFHTGYQAKCVHLPIDVKKYRFDTIERSNNYFLAVGTPREIDIDLISNLGRKFRILYPGKQAIPHCENLGYVSDEKLINLYGNAIATIFPHHHEEFGLIPVESMACGTPVLTYDYQGPGETVLSGVTGWTVDTQSELLDKVEEIAHLGVSAGMRSDCIDYVRDRFSASACTSEFLKSIPAL